MAIRVPARTVIYMITRLLAGTAMALAAAGASVPAYAALETRAASAVLTASAQNIQTDAAYTAGIQGRPETSADLVAALAEVPSDVAAGYTLTVSDSTHATLTAASGSVCIGTDGTDGTITEGTCNG